uniref:Uncharacterized protein n=1 Tax=Anguilla anguilla TaxID=7936 RepID=A0A0E9W8V7_ANGAN
MFERIRESDSCYLLRSDTGSFAGVIMERCQGGRMLNFSQHGLACVYHMRPL